VTRSKPKLSVNPSGFYWIWYLLPALAVYIIFMAFPLLDSVRASFFKSSAGNTDFVGLANYIELFTTGELSVRYWGALRNTSVFFIIHMLVQNVLGILFATILTNPKMRGRHIYQTIIFIPTTFAVLVTGYLWRLLLNPIWAKGLWDAIGLPQLAQPWLGQDATALTAVSLVSCWQWMGIPVMMFVAALRGISEDLYEAASIEGASGWKLFRYIKLPLIMPVVGMIIILTFVNNFNAFDIVYSMQTANGAPNYTTDLLGTLFYRVGIAGQHPVAIPNSDMGSTIVTVTFLMLAAVSLFVLSKTRTKEAG
jgi:raffinose/stachyose/melibiose transport system permease protein